MSETCSAQIAHLYHLCKGQSLTGSLCLRRMQTLSINASYATTKFSIKLNMILMSFINILLWIQIFLINFSP